MRGFVIAMACEAAAVESLIGADDRLLVCGIGKVNAAAATQRLIDAGATEIFNLGVVGALDAACRVGDVFEIERAVEYDFDLADVNGAGVGVLDGRDSPYFACAPRGLFPSRILATGDRFTDRDDDLNLLASLGCTLRDMEGAAIAHVCELSGIPCRLLKSVSDVHGCGSMVRQYRENRAAALASLARAARTFLQ